MAEGNIDGSRYLAKQFPTLAGSAEVDHAVSNARRDGVKVKDSAGPRIDVYLARLENILNHPNERVRERNISFLENRFLDNVTISAEASSVPDSYIKLQKRIAREQGYGDIEISEKVLQGMAETLSEDQRTSLTEWTNYLSSSDAAYPSWFKYYVLRSVTGLSKYNKEKGVFPKRDKDTVDIFPDLDRGALALVYDNLVRVNGGSNNGEILEPELERIIKQGNFGKIYLEAIKESNLHLTDEQLKSVDGEWVKYDKGADPSALYESLKGKGTGWCTQGLETARAQLELGDFYVFYSKDENNDPKNPRIAIRMQNGKVAEVRGIGNRQEMELEFLDTAEEKLKDLPGAQEFKRKFENMKRLTELDKKVKENEELSTEDLRFLYEIDSFILGFGYDKDPRIDEILKGRNRREDYTKIFNCSPKEVALYAAELDDDTRVYDGSLDSKAAKFIRDHKKPLFIAGGLYLDASAEVDIEQLPDDLSIRESLILENLRELTHLPENLRVGKNITLAGLRNLQSIPAELKIPGSLSINTGTSPTLPDGLHVGGDFSVFASFISSLPKNLRVEGKMRLMKVEKVTSLPEGLYIGGDLTAITTGIKSIPKDAQILGEIKIF